MDIKTSGDVRREELGPDGLRVEARKLMESARGNRKIGYSGAASSQEHQARLLRRTADCLESR